MCTTQTSQMAQMALALSSIEQFSEAEVACAGYLCYGDTWLSTNLIPDAKFSQQEGRLFLDPSNSDTSAELRDSGADACQLSVSWSDNSEDWNGVSWLPNCHITQNYEFENQHFTGQLDNRHVSSSQTPIPGSSPLQHNPTALRDFSGASAGYNDTSADVTILPASVLFRDYTVDEMIGEGRYGTIWRCYSNFTRELFACKQISRGNACASSVQVAKEIQCLAAAQGHANVLRLEAVFESEKFAYILTEYCDSGDLFDVISRRVHLTEGEARTVFAELLRATAHCHRRGVLHRDLKPENVLLHTCRQTGRVTVKLADFGLSTALRPGECVQGWVGSKPYDAPEVSTLLPYSFPSDIYSLGVVLFAMLSGNWPTRGEGGFCPTQDFVYPVWGEISAQAKRMVSRMLAQDPEMRPTAEELLFEPWLYPVVQASQCSLFT